MALPWLRKVTRRSGYERRPDLVLYHFGMLEPSRRVKFIIFLVLAAPLAYLGFLLHTATPKPAEAVEKSLNLNDPDALYRKYQIYAKSYCESNADAFLRHAAKYDFRWETVGLLGQKFDHYLPKVALPGVLTMVSNRLMLQNGFGAYQRMVLYCSYDTQRGGVVDYSLFDDR
jgi:hypothetical protein